MNFENPFIQIYNAFDKYRLVKAKHATALNELESQKSEFDRVYQQTKAFETPDQFIEFDIKIKQLKIKVDEYTSNFEAAKKDIEGARKTLVEAIYYPEKKFDTATPEHSWVMKSAAGVITYENEDKDSGHVETKFQKVYVPGS